MKRNIKALVNAHKLQVERDKMFSENQDRLIAMVADLQETVLKMSCQLSLRKKIDIDEFFPIKSLNQVKSFLNKSDGLFHLRREEFENFVYCNVTKNNKLKRPFEATLMATVFARDFITSHKWPGIR